MIAPLVLFASLSFAQGTKYIPPELDKLLLEGVDEIYRSKFDRAEESARKAIALSPEHPNPYMGMAGIAWTRYVYQTDQGDDRLIGEFDAWTNKTIEAGQRWLKTHPNDAQAMMTLGAAYGLSSRLMLIQQRWVSGYLQGRKALKLTTAAVKTDPELWDGYLGLGMYDYYSDLYPRFIGVLSRLVLRGNRKRGIEELKLVAEKGHYSKHNAQILLVEIYTSDPFGAKDPEKAVALMKQLRAEFPESAMMHSAELVAQFTAGKYQQVVDSARAYLKNVDEKRYDAIQEAKGAVALACGLWAVGKREEALESFRRAQRVPYNGRMSRWAVWASIRAGNLEDAMGRRADALKDYKLAMGEPDRWGFRAIAKGYVSKAYGKPMPESIDPP